MSIQALNNNSAVSSLPPPSVGAAPAPALEETKAVQPIQAKPAPPTQQQLEAAVKEVARVVQPKASNLDFSVDHDSGKTIVRITDRQTGEMIRQIPSEEMVELAKSLDRMQGLLMRQKV